MILTAGFGTRMNELSKKIPKPLLPVFNIPLIHYQLYQLQKAGVDHVILNLHHKAHKIKKALGSEFESIKLHYSEEKPKILGTGGGLKQVEKLLQEKKFLLLNGDFVTDLPLKSLWKTHTSSQALATLLVTSLPSEPADLNIDKNNFVTEFTKNGTYMFCGVHVLENRIFNYLKPGYSCIIKDGYIKILNAKTEKLKVLVHKKTFYNFGTFDLYLKNQLNILNNLKSNRFFLKLLKHFFPHLKEVKKGIWITESLKNTGILRSLARSRIKIKPPIFIGRHVRIEKNCTIGPEVILGDGAVIQKNSTIKNSIILKNKTVKKDSKIINQIIF